MAADDALKSPRPFDMRTIKVLVGLMAQHDLSEVDLIEGDQRIRLRRGPRHVPYAAVPAPAAAMPAPAAPHSAPPAPASAAPPAPAAAAKPGTFIKSPTPGTFYTAANPESPPFITVGQRVSPSTVVCIIEAMKIFNEIQAECSGVITKVLAQNGQPVEYDQPLFEVDPTA